MLRIARMGSQVANPDAIEEPVRDALQMVTQKTAGNRRDCDMIWAGNWERVMLNSLAEISSLVLDKRWKKIKRALSAPVGKKEENFVEPPKYEERLRFCGECANGSTPETAEPCRTCALTPERQAFKAKQK